MSYIYNYRPNDFTDLGEAELFAKMYHEKIRFCPGIGYIVYNGVFWEANDSKAQLLMQQITTCQMNEADDAVTKYIDLMNERGITKKIACIGKNKAIDALSGDDAEIYSQYLQAKEYLKFTMLIRSSSRIEAALKQAKPIITIDPDELDKNPFYVNTPDDICIVNNGFQFIEHTKHSPDALLTKCTAVSPSLEGMNIWDQALDVFFCGDKDLIDYTQQIVGMSIIGKVCMESLVIAYGSGKNGKSSFWNVIARVLGTYAGNIAADVLTVQSGRNIMPELAEVKGKRLLIASELDEGTRLNTGTLKRLCSTDPIVAAKKYQQPITFVPTHTLVMYTNHLPKVGARDDGTWRKLLVIPFNAKIDSDSEIRNYDDYLFEHAGGAILTWILHGAAIAYSNDYKIVAPAAVKNAISDYRADNDWLMHFIDSCCDVGDTYRARAGELYEIYRSYSASVGDFIRTNAEFSNALVSAGYEKHKTKSGMVFIGLQNKST